MLSRTLSFLLLVLAISLPVSAASPQKARPLSGIGLLLVRGSVTSLIVYREPHLGRLAEVAATKLPGLAPSLPPSGGYTPAVVLSRRPGWLRIVYDPSESDGWVERRRAGEFQPWEQFLAGRSLRMLPGLRQDYYRLQREASPGAENLRNVGQEERLPVLEVVGDWVKVSSADGSGGWLRWRDDNSRLLVRLTPVE